jgi:hypothetical protein
MRLHIFFGVILIFFGVAFSFCDVGHCVRYKAELTFDDGRQLSGFIQIASLRVLETCLCEHGDFSEIKTPRPEDLFLIHYHHWIIEELTQDEIDLLQTEPVFMIDRESPITVEGIDRLVVFCYDPSLSESEFNRLASGFYSDLSSEKESSQKSWEEKIRHYKQVKEELRKKKIITLIIRSYN